MRNKIYIILIAFLVAGMILSSHTNQSVLAQPVELRLATWSPPPPDVGDIAVGLVWFANEIEKRTIGKAKIKIFWGGSLAKQMELPRAVKSGMADMASIVGVYHPELFPYVQGSSQACFVFAGTELGDWIKPYRKFYKEFAEERDSFTKQNQKLLAFWEYDKMDIISTKPIRNFAEAKGVKIRNSGEYLPRIFRAVGFSSISLPATEAYLALQRGMVDAIHATADTSLRYKWYETCKYYTEVPIFGTTMVYFLSINLDTWNKLPADVQSIMVKVGEELTDIYPSISKKTRDDFKKVFIDNGGTFLKFSEADQKEWKEKTAGDTIENYIKKMEEKGIPRVKEGIHRFAELLNFKW